MQSVRALQVAVPAFRDSAEQRAAVSLVEYFQVRQVAASMVSKAGRAGKVPRGKPAAQLALQLARCPICSRTACNIYDSASSSGQVAAWSDWEDASEQMKATWGCCAACEVVSRHQGCGVQGGYASNDSAACRTNV